MKIISKFKDYYDYIPDQFGIDNRRVYNRITKDIVSEDSIKPGGYYGGSYNKDTMLVINNTTSLEREFHDGYKYDKVAKNIKDKSVGYWFTVAINNLLYQGLYHTETNSFHYKRETLPGEILEYLNAGRKIWKYRLTSKDDSLFTPEPTKINSILKEPIAISHKITFKKEEGIDKVSFDFVSQINPNLSKINFGSCLSANDIFQNIYDFVAPYEPNTNNKPTDMNRFESKGFDKKISFRNIK